MPLQESIGLLVAAVRRLVKQAVTAAAVEHGLSYQQFWYLVAIAETEGLSQRELAGRLRTDAPTASRVVASLVRRGLARSGEDPQDRRRRVLVLTPRGAALARRLVPVATRMRAAMIEGLPEEERDALRQSLRKVIGNMERLVGQGGPAEREERTGMRTRRTRAARKAVATMGMLLALGASGGCARRAAGAAGGPPPAPVVAARVESRDVPVEALAIGTVEAYSTVALRPQVSGPIASVHFAEGADVKASDLLFTIDPRPFQATLSQAESALARDRAQAKNAAAEAERAESLFRQGILSKEQHDSAHASAEALAATVQADEAAVQNARLQVSYTSVRAPVSGRTGAVLVQAGNVVQAVTGGPLVVINQVEPVYVSFALPEPRLAELRRAAAGGKLPVQAILAGDPKGPAEGQLSFVDNQVDRSTGTFRLKATFANRDRRLWPGQFVNARIVLDVRRNAVVAASAAVQSGQQGTYVFVVKPDHTAEMRRVTTGPAAGDDVVIEKGLSPGETVVTDGHVRVVPGAPVEVKEPARGAAPAKAS
ncbi:MAG: efflux RND transporter periplasmic adaptor subunit [Vicinamibacteria bacterium]